jgi:hypothetical protein
MESLSDFFLIKNNFNFKINYRKKKKLPTPIVLVYKKFGGQA